MTARTEYLAHLRERVERNLADMTASKAGRRCIECAHVHHNELGYCQVGQCPCKVGTSIAATAQIVLRDLAPLLAALNPTPTNTEGPIS